MVGNMAGPRELLLAARADAVRRAAALEREFADLAEAASAGGTDDEHDPEGATLAFERQHTAALLDQAREQVAAIDAALGRLEAGRYGVCERCGQPIGDDRLAARPAALTCVRCAVLPSAAGQVSYSARSANAVRVLAAQPAGPSAPATAMARPARASRTSPQGWYTLSTEGGTSVCAAWPMTGST
jgi:DnaK suppressor protein